MTMPGCVSYDRSLWLLNLDNMDGAYGLHTDVQCMEQWRAIMRDGWQRYLLTAQNEIERDIGKAVCPRPIYNERHSAQDQFTTRQVPVAYIGRMVYSEWEDVDLIDDIAAEEMYFILCTDDIPEGYTIDDYEFSWPLSITECYRGQQVLQEPCITPLDDCGDGGPGYRIEWLYRFLVGPTAENLTIERDEIDPFPPTNLIDTVRYRLGSVDETQAVVAVGSCGCHVCNGSTPIYTAELVDAISGYVCVTNVNGCVNRQSQVYINYATSLNPYGNVDPTIEESIVQLALVRSMDTTVRPCGCDNTHIERLLAFDETAKTEFARKLTYGPTVAGMNVMRMVEKYTRKPDFNQVGTEVGGLLISNQNRDRRKNPFFNAWS